MKTLQQLADESFEREYAKFPKDKKRPFSYDESFMHGYREGEKDVLKLRRTLRVMEESLYEMQSTIEVLIHNLRLELK